MQQGVLHNYPDTEVEYKFKCRTKGIDLIPIINKVDECITDLCEKRFQPAELNFLASHKFLTPDYIQLLSMFKLNRDYVHIDVVNGKFDLRIKGPWLHTILFEVPIMSIISEAWATEANTTIGHDYRRAKKELDKKIAMVKRMYEKYGIRILFADFGGRRRHDFRWHSGIVKYTSSMLPDNFIGTSNVLLAMLHGLKAIGTQAHEWFQAHQQLGFRLVDAQKAALDTWTKEFRGALGIALTDVIGIDAFLRDFDLFFSKLFDGVRHDSGCPYKFGEKMINHYKSFGIDPMTKTLIFSDGLNFRLMCELAYKFEGRIKVAFGIGTNFTNDFIKKALNIVLKMVTCNGQPVAKISDSFPGKTMCESQSFINHICDAYGVKI
jgi:nicotinate phosphoribosyltransferase